MDKMQLISRQNPGVVSIENFEQLKSALSGYLSKYKGAVYTENMLSLAKDDKKELSRLRKEIDDKRKEIKKSYLEPYNEFETKVKELIGLIDEPLNDIKEFISGMDEREKEKKKEKIKEFYKSISSPLGKLADEVFESTAFFNDKWLNKTTQEKSWRDDITQRVSQVSKDLTVIKKAGGSDTTALVAKYLDSMDIETVLEYKKSLDSKHEKVDDVQTFLSEENNISAYKIVRFSGTEQKINELIEQALFSGVEVEIVEDGFPSEMTEETEPVFDSFVCFDIETSGSFGAASGDTEAEITEIGAVKVINGQIADKRDWMCNPGRRIVPMLERKTHITNDMVKDEPPVSEQIKKFVEFVGDLPVVGHNIKASDLHYIGKAAKRAGAAFSTSYFDTYLYAKKFKEAKGWSSLKLEYLTDFFGIDQPSAHRAWCDAEANTELYFKLKNIDKN